MLGTTSPRVPLGVELTPSVLVGCLPQAIDRGAVAGGKREMAQTR